MSDKLYVYRSGVLLNHCNFFIQSLNYTYSNQCIGLLLRKLKSITCFVTDDPKVYLAEQLEKLQNARTTRVNFPRLFDESNISAIFGMLDPTNRGFITLAQYREGTLYTENVPI